MQTALVPWACDPARTRGRRRPEPQARDRNDFQRDRDRIVHSTAFRRLVYKTQVFINHEGDLFRTRLTHSLEVAQLARSVARSLGLHEDLVEAVALAHDLGHTPFGHAGQDALHACMHGHGGFEHNLQSLRVVDRLEQRYADFDGLNLCFETREGILKHCSATNARALEAAEPGGVGRRFLDGHQPSLEAQVTNLADEIAYNVHDIDDGVRSGLLTESQLAGQVPLFDRCRVAALAEHPALASSALAKRLLAETLRRMLSAQVHDLIEATAERLREAGPVDVEGVRRSRPLVCFSAAMRAEVDGLKRFLLHSLYRHPQVLRMTDAARRTVAELFDAYRQAPEELPPDHRGRTDAARAVADYVAGMTDRFAIREHRRLTGRMHFDGHLVPGPGES